MSERNSALFSRYSKVSEAESTLTSMSVGSNCRAAFSVKSVTKEADLLNRSSVKSVLFLSRPHTITLVVAFSIEPNDVQPAPVANVVRSRLTRAEEAAEVRAHDRHQR